MRHLEAQWARLLAAGTVRWMPGMKRSDTSHRVIEVSNDALVWSAGSYKGGGLDRVHWWSRDTTPLDAPGLCPDWTDPATLGCLLAMAREVVGPQLSAWADINGEWRSWSAEVELDAYPTEAAALLAAIEAAL